ncbi:uncharacterized protein BXZ73DRAFT_87658 [Epithele typhae]|uniref:uncharacterized protein n=1 Tax=Epithele typhae TaxID=378194 RepID=UPI00200794C1|nr:uncharacterized protein BXZ73DRAFT_87658 [Epithele typhae]KAH9943306.1 hypothetical protein BXZ73DRAFT_87658 [Epithele typhae]
MDPPQYLKQLLQVQLATDSAAVLHLPFILETLTREHLAISPHTGKWTSRVNSLIHAKDFAAKWCGLCLAFQSATLCKSVLLEHGESWLKAAVPLLGVRLFNQTPATCPRPTSNAAMRLTRLIAVGAMDVPEFQRLVCVPNVPIVVKRLVAMAEEDGTTEALLPILETITHLVSFHPSLCRPLHTALSNLALRSLNGSAPTNTPHELVEACSNLYCVLPLTGGKVNAPTLWRKSLDNTIAFAWGAFLGMRNTLENPNDPLIGVSLGLDRLRAAMRVVDDLLRCITSSPIPRPVVLPVGSLVRLCLALLQCSSSEKGLAGADTIVETMERVIVPTLRKLGCQLVVSVSKAARHHITPHMLTLLTVLAYHLEQNLDDAIVASRLTRTIVPHVAVLLSTRSQANVEEEHTTSQGKSKKGKKRARDFEGDEVFKLDREIICPTATEGDILLISLDLLEILLVGVQVSPSVYSIGCRSLLAIQASFSRISPALLSPDLSLYRKLQGKLLRVCVHLAIGTSSTMSKSLGLVLGLSDSTSAETGELTIPTELDVILHPRVPPMVRSLPHVEALSLFRSEEGREELDARNRMGLDLVGELRLNEATAVATEAASLQPQPTRIGVAMEEAVAPEMELQTFKHSTLVSTTQTPMQVEDPPSITPAAISSRAPAPGPPTVPKFAAPPAEAQVTSWHAEPLLEPTFRTTSSSGPVNTPMDEEDDEDEPMPTIDMNSDSESE